MDTKVRIKINGQDHSMQFHEVSIHQKVFSHSSIMAVLGIDYHTSADTISMVHNKWMGAIMEVEIFDSVVSSIKKIYKGTIVNLKSSVNEIVIEARSNDFLLNYGNKFRSWRDSEGMGIAKEVIDDLGLKTNAFSVNNSIKHTFFQQYDETDHELLMRIARIDGCVFYDDGEGFVYVDSLKDNHKVKLELDEVENVNLISELNKTKWTGMPYAFTKHTEPSLSRSSTIPAPSHPFSSIMYNKSKTLFDSQVSNSFTETVINPKDYDNFMKNQQRATAGELVKLEAIVNNPMVFIGRTISSKEHPILKDPIFVTEIFATFKDNIYTGNIKGVSPDSILAPPIDESKLSKFKMEIATVIDNLDPDKLGRVQIKYLWDIDGRAQTWARVGQFGAGMTSNGVAYGTHFTPRIGDHVIVTAEHGDPSKPLVIGSIYHSEKKPNFISENGTDEILMMKTPQENEIRINDKSDSEEILIQQKSSKNIIKLILKDPKIYIESVKGLIEVKAENIHFKADEEFKIEAKTFNIKISENMTTEVQQNIKAKAGKDFTNESTGNYKINATQNAEITGLAFKAKASTNAEISGTAGVKVSGAMVESSASGINTVKGSMVMIN
jgi:type VI secretion system secreted protein VgrG